MSEAEQDPSQKSNKTFADEAEQESVGIVREFIDFLRYNKKWWLMPIVLVLLGLGVLVFLFNSPAAPFTGPLVSWGGSTSNYGLAFDAASATLYGWDDDTREIIQIR